MLAWCAWTREPAGALLPGWTRVRNDAAGFTLSVPPGWTARGSGRSSTLLRSRGGALAVAGAADRSNDGAHDAPVTYVQRTVRNLPGYRRLRIGRPVPVPGLRYPAAGVAATGTFARTGVRQAIALYALHRPGRVTYTVAVFRSAAIPVARSAPYVAVILRSFRARPPQV
jgi:hypothetical protein